MQSEEGKPEALSCETHRRLTAAERLQNARLAISTLPFSPHHSSSHLVAHIISLRERRSNGSNYSTCTPISHPRPQAGNCSWAPHCSSRAMASASNAASVTGTDTCQDAIQQHLKIDPARSSDALLLLCQREVDQEENEEGALPHCGTTCCFDMENKPPRWSAARLCTRCDAVNHMLQVTREGSSIRESAVRTTQCASESVRQGVVRNLPIEIIEMILASFIDELQPEFDEDGSGNFSEHFLLYTLYQVKLNTTIRSLLHTSKGVRAWLTKFFPPRMPKRSVKLELDANSGTQYYEAMGEVHSTIGTFVEEVMRWYLFQGAHQKVERPALPDCYEGIIGGTAVTHLRMEVIVLDEEGRPEGAWVKLTKVGAARRGGGHSTALLTVRDACEALLDSFRRVLPPPCETNPYFCCLRWQCPNVDPTAKIAIKLYLPAAAGQDSPQPKSWIYYKHVYGAAFPESIFRSK